MSNIKTDQILNKLLSYNELLHTYVNSKKNEYIEFITAIFSRFDLSENSKRIIDLPNEYFENANDIKYLKKYFKYKKKYLSLKNNNY